MALHKINGCDNTARDADVIFVHGLDGDHRTTWQIKNSPESFWPAWLGEDYPSIGVWSLDYPAAALGWKGDSMPLTDRAKHTLNGFEHDGIGERPIGFICHSLGGLLTKQILRSALDSKNEAWQKISKQARFILFLSTPHSGAGMANWLRYIGTLLRTSISVRELEAHHPQLRDLNVWYRDHAADLGISNFVYCESRKTGKMIFKLGGILVVDQTSADPGIAGVTPIALDEDHISICKPESRDTPVYRQVKAMVDSMRAEAVQPEEPPPPVTVNSTPAAPQPSPGKTNQDYPGQNKIELCDRLHDSWEKLADQLDVPVPDRKLFNRGREPHELWDWLKARDRLAELEPALTAIGRADLAEILRNHPR